MEPFDTRNRVEWLWTSLDDFQMVREEAPWIETIWDGLSEFAKLLPDWVEENEQAGQNQGLVELDAVLDTTPQFFEALRNSGSLDVPRYLVSPFETLLNSYIDDGYSYSLAMLYWAEARNYATDAGKTCPWLAAQLENYGCSDKKLIDKLKRFVLVACPFGGQDDCLMHPVIAHEVSHAVLYFAGTRLGEIDLPRPGDTGVLVRWLNEILCDIVATHMLGPLPAISMRYRLPQQVRSDTHPPTDLRLAACKEMLRREAYLAPADTKADDAQKFLDGLLPHGTPTGDSETELLSKLPSLCDNVVEAFPDIQYRSEVEAVCMTPPHTEAEPINRLLSHVPPAYQSLSPLDLRSAYLDDANDQLEAEEFALCEAWLAAWTVRLDQDLWKQFGEPFAQHGFWSHSRAEGALSDLTIKAIEVVASHAGE